MIRLKKFDSPRMVSARVEKTEFDKFNAVLGAQRVLTLQDFIVFAFNCFNRQSIIITDRGFEIKTPENEHRAIDVFKDKENHDS